MEEKDYTNLIPEPPTDLVDYVKKHGKLKQGWLVYKCGFRENEQTHKKEECLDAVCTECGTHFKADRTPAPAPEQHCSWGKPPEYSRFQGKIGKIEIKTNELIKCPHCGVKVMCLHTSEIYRTGYCVWPLVINKVGGAIVAAAYRIMKTPGKDGLANVTVDKYEAYIFDPVNKKKVRCTAVERVFYSEHFTNVWMQRRRFVDAYGIADIIYSKRNIFKNTTFQNCRLSQYMKASDDPRPISYLTAFMRRPHIENLLVQQCQEILESVVKKDYELKEVVNLKEKSPRRMLGVSKPDFAHVKGFGAKQLKAFKQFRAVLPAEPPARLAHLAKEFVWSPENLIKECNRYGIKLINYLSRVVDKKQYTGERYALSDWEDYLAAAKTLGYDLNDPNTLFPRNLKTAHDNAIKARKYKENEALRARFEERYNELLPLAFQNDQFLIRPAQTENELITEGKILSHCVGGYGKAHCNEDPIFFIRKTVEPDTPYFTLQLSLKSGTIRQNRGKRNCDPPQDVMEFATLWLQEIVSKVKTQKRQGEKSQAA